MQTHYDVLNHAGEFAAILKNQNVQYVLSSRQVMVALVMINANRWSLSDNRIKMARTMESMLAWLDSATTKELKTTEPKAKKAMEAKMANT